MSSVCCVDLDLHLAPERIQFPLTKDWCSKHQLLNSLYDGQYTLSIQLIKPVFRVLLPPSPPPPPLKSPALPMETALEERREGMLDVGGGDRWSKTPRGWGGGGAKVSYSRVDS